MNGRLPLIEERAANAQKWIDDWLESQVVTSSTTAVGSSRRLDKETTTADERAADAQAWIDEWLESRSAGKRKTVKAKELGKQMTGAKKAAVVVGSVAVVVAVVRVFITGAV